MSIKAMQYVFDSTTTKGAQRLMLLSIADRCNDEGECYPGVTYLAKKCNITRRQAVNLINALERRGEIKVVEGAGIDVNGGQTNRYFMSAYQELYNIQPSIKKEPRKAKDRGVLKITGGVESNRGGSVESNIQSQVVSQDNSKKNISPSVDSGDSEKNSTQFNDMDKTEQSFDMKQNIYDLSLICKEKLDLHNGRDFQIARMLCGQPATKQPFKELAQYFTENPVVPHELEATIMMFRTEYPDATLFQSPQVIADWIGKNRNAKAHSDLKQQQFADIMAKTEQAMAQRSKVLDITPMFIDT